MLPPPKDPSKLPKVTEEEFFNPQGEEDETLLASGAWDEENETAADTVTSIKDELKALKELIGKKNPPR